MEILAGISGVVWVIMAALVFLSPIFLYLTQRNTYQTRQELRKLNKSINQLIKLAEKQQLPPATPKLLKMTCPMCNKDIKYRSSHSGKKKTCPSCNNAILLK